MRFSKTFVTSLLASLAVAGPAAKPRSETHVSRQDDQEIFEPPEGYEDPVDPNEPHLSSEQQCMSSNQVWGLRYNVVINNADEHTADECGSGFLDNLRGQGCTDTQWGCNYSDDGKTMNANFQTGLGCHGGKVSDAIGASFGGAEVECLDYDNNPDFAIPI